jgi:hypothetical protein
MGAAPVVTEEEAHRQAEDVALGMGITICVVPAVGATFFRCKSRHLLTKARSTASRSGGGSVTANDAAVAAIAVERRALTNREDRVSERSSRFM